MSTQYNQNLVALECSCPGPIVDPGLRHSRLTLFVLAMVFVFLSGVSPLHAAVDYLTPGTLRVDNVLSLEGVFHATRPGWAVRNAGVDKVYSRTDDKNPSWQSEWGQRLMTDIATQVNENIRARVLIETQGEYADRFWRPINLEHRASRRGEHIFFKEAEGRIDHDRYFLHAYSGVQHGDWGEKGDFFKLYPFVYPYSGYLGSSGFYGIHPKRYDRNHYHNISDRQVPRGAEAGANWLGMEAGVAYGSELSWGHSDSVFSRLQLPIGKSKFTFVYQDKDAPYAEDDDERDRAITGAWEIPFGLSGVFTVGSIFRPYRSGEAYITAEPVAAGAGIQGSSWQISESRAKDSDGLGYRARLQAEPEFLGRLWAYAIDFTYLDILAGNKSQIDLDAGTYVTSLIRLDTRYTYRKPIEGPVPFLFEGTPNNIGNVVASPRSQESPFLVDWTNREAVFVLATLQINPNPYTPIFEYSPHEVARWNLKKQNAPHYALAGQYRMSDYRTTTDRQHYFDINGNIVYESPLSNGASATKHPLHEFRIMNNVQVEYWNIFFGIAAGQTPAISGLAYSDTTNTQKSLTEYFSLEAEITRYPFSLRGHYGSGVWGPEPHNDPFFGESFDRLWGYGGSYKITKHTTLDVDYLAARQDDNLFVAPDLGSYDEIRTVLSHRFGLELQFQD